MGSEAIALSQDMLTLNKMIEDGAKEHQDFIMEVAGNAKGEAELSREMNVIKDFWATRELVVAQYRDTKDRFQIKEVEDLISAHAAVQSVAVVGKSDDFLGEVPVAFVIAMPGDHDEKAVEEEIVATCKDKLASFKVPRAVYFVDAFPTGTLDKILKNRLREIADAR